MDYTNRPWYIIALAKIAAVLMLIFVILLIAWAIAAVIKDIKRILKK